MIDYNSKKNKIHIIKNKLLSIYYSRNHGGSPVKIKSFSKHKLGNYYRLM